MQNFIDAATGQVYAFEDDVAVDQVNGVYTFTTAHGVLLDAPDTLQPYTPPEQTQAELVAAAQVIQLSTLSVAYQAALAENVSYTTVAGQVASFQSDDLSVARLSRAVLAYLTTQKTPDGFYWVAADNTQVAFSYADLQGLAAALGAQSESAFTKYQELKAKINAATTVADVVAVTWGAD
ncbi:DUF4376 domain-containing protein [Burkholderia cenocepacia]|uniref:DUF4376 domain-containing protein n=1 Tax=Burkholderia cenocepacia TaxID=95486 RepID=UPI0038CC0186